MLGVDKPALVHKHIFNGLPVFRGISRVQILYDKIGKRWVIYDSSSLPTNETLDDHKIWAYHQFDDWMVNLPIGVKNWTIFRPSGKSEHKLKLSNVRTNKLTFNTVTNLQILLTII